MMMKMIIIMGQMMMVMMMITSLKKDGFDDDNNAGFMQAMKMVKQGRGSETLDPNLAATTATEFVVERVYAVVQKCLKPTREGRPTMRRCAEQLWAIRKDHRSLASAEAPLRFSRVPRT